MLFLKNWGRWVYLITWIFSRVVYLLLSLAQVASGPAVGYELSSIMCALSGVLIALAFYSPVSQAFATSPQAERGRKTDVVYDVD